jgi:DNA modification methylase
MTPWLDDGDVRLYHGDNLDVLRQLPDKSVHMCATSPPFYGLRDYGTGLWEGGDPDCDHVPKPDTSERQRYTTGGSLKRGGDDFKARESCSCGARRVDQQIGLEDTPDQWVERLVAVFREVRRVLRDDGTLWCEIGDSYVSGQGGRQSNVGEMPAAPLALTSDGDVGRDDVDTGSWRSGATSKVTPARGTTDLKPKDLLGQPWLLAFALRADGWYLRSEIIWARPNPMPESVTDRPTKSHSTVFMLSKQPRYHFDQDAIREAYSPHSDFGNAIPAEPMPSTVGDSVNDRRIHARLGNGSVGGNHSGANARSVWQIPTQPTPFAHFATWPEALVRRMILAGTSERGCCPECGAPWVRETEVDPAYAAGVAYANERRRAGAKGAGADGLVNANAGNLGPGAPRTKTNVTLGWSPSCRCIEQMGSLEEPSGVPFPTPVPCTVLDPFAGSATTCLVARNHGRHSIGIELNEDYLQIAAKRLQQLSLLNT